MNFRFSIAVFEFSVLAVTDVGLSWFIFLTADDNSQRAFPDSEQIFVHGS